MAKAPVIPIEDSKRRQLDISDNIAYLLHGASIKGAYRRKSGGRDLILAGLTDTNAPFIITIQAVHYLQNMDPTLLAVAECDGSKIAKLVEELKRDIDKAEGSAG